MMRRNRAQTWDHCRETPTAAGVPIVHQPGRCGGYPTVGHTRRTVHWLIGMIRDHGSLADARALEFPHWSEAEVAAALEYYALHAAEIDAILREHKWQWRPAQPEGRGR